MSIMFGQKVIYPSSYGNLAQGYDQSNQNEARVPNATRADPERVLGLLIALVMFSPRNKTAIGSADQAGAVPAAQTGTRRGYSDLSLVRS